MGKVRLIYRNNCMIRRIVFLFIGLFSIMWFVFHIKSGKYIELLQFFVGSINDNSYYLSTLLTKNPEATKSILAITVVMLTQNLFFDGISFLLDKIGSKNKSLTYSGDKTLTYSKDIISKAFIYPTKIIILFYMGVVINNDLFIDLYDNTLSSLLIKTEIVSIVDIYNRIIGFFIVLWAIRLAGILIGIIVRYAIICFLTIIFSILCILPINKLFSENGTRKEIVLFIILVLIFTVTNFLAECLINWIVTKKDINPIIGLIIKALDYESVKSLLVQAIIRILQTVCWLSGIGMLLFNALFNTVLLGDSTDEYFDNFCKYFSNFFRNTILNIISTIFNAIIISPFAILLYYYISYCEKNITNPNIFIILLISVILIISIYFVRTINFRTYNMILNTHYKDLRYFFTIPVSSIKNNFISDMFTLLIWDILNLLSSLGLSLSLIVYKKSRDIIRNIQV